MAAATAVYVVSVRAAAAAATPASVPVPVPVLAPASVALPMVTVGDCIRVSMPKLGLVTEVASVNISLPLPLLLFRL